MVVVSSPLQDPSQGSKSGAMGEDELYETKAAATEVAEDIFSQDKSLQ